MCLLVFCRESHVNGCLHAAVVKTLSCRVWHFGECMCTQAIYCSHLNGPTICIIEGLPRATSLPTSSCRLPHAVDHLMTDIYIHAFGLAVNDKTFLAQGGTCYRWDLLQSILFLRDCPNLPILYSTSYTVCVGVKVSIASNIIVPMICICWRYAHTSSGPYRFCARLLVNISELSDAPAITHSQTSTLQKGSSMLA